MVPIWPDKVSRVRKLIFFATLFNNAGFDTSAYIVSKLARRMIEVTYVDELMPILNLELYPSYQNDWQRFNYTSRLFQSLFELQDFYLTKVEATSPESMTQTYQVGEILDARNEPLNIANSIYRLIDKTDDHMEKFFLGCYQYLVAVDGVFDQTIRALYVLASIFYKEPKTLANSRSLDVEHRDDRRTRNEEIEIEEKTGH